MEQKDEVGSDKPDCETTNSDKAKGRTDDTTGTRTGQGKGQGAGQGRGRRS